MYIDINIHICIYIYTCIHPLYLLLFRGDVFVACAWKGTATKDRSSEKTRTRFGVRKPRSLLDKKCPLRMI